MFPFYHSSFLYLSLSLSLSLSLPVYVCVYLCVILLSFICWGRPDNMCNDSRPPTVLQLKLFFFAFSLIFPLFLYFFRFYSVLLRSGHLFFFSFTKEIIQPYISLFPHFSERFRCAFHALDQICYSAVSLTFSTGTLSRVFEQFSVLSEQLQSSF